MRKKFVHIFKLAEKEGAKIEIGGSKVLTNEFKKWLLCSPYNFFKCLCSMRVSQEEIFGPVLTIIGFDEEVEAISIANNVKYGLAGYVWTKNLNTALRVTNKLNAGMIWINSENVRHLPTPFGGMKESGIGRDGGDWSFDFYMETKNVCLPTNDKDIKGLTN